MQLASSGDINMINKFHALVLALPVFLLSAGSALAQEWERERPNYNYVSLQYVYNAMDVDTDALPNSITKSSWYFGEGGQLDASYALDDFVLFRGSYYTASGDFKGGRDIDFDSGLVGVGVIVPTDDAIGIDLSLDYRSDNLKFNRDGNVKNIDQDVEGLGLSFGVRAKVTETSELGLRFGVYAGDFDQSVGVNLSYIYNFSENWAITAGYEYMDVGLDSSDKVSYETNKWLAGGRFAF
jgi:opacity protein-like surface antigen